MSEDNNNENLVRLNKLMAEKGICSRREADAYIEKGLVFVDGQRVSQPGTKVNPMARVTLDAEALQKQKSLITVILNKPIGYVSNLPEKGYEPAIRLITSLNQWDKDPLRGKMKLNATYDNLAVTGRLDIDSQGLLIFTQDGRLAKRIIGENSEIEKEYLVRVAGDLPPDQLKLLRHGLELDGKKLKPAQVSWINEDQLKFILKEGKKRQIRRMCELVGLKVLGLKRVRVGKLKLGPLPEGQWRFLLPDEEI